MDDDYRGTRPSDVPNNDDVSGALCIPFIERTSQSEKSVDYTAF